MTSSVGSWLCLAGGSTITGCDYALFFINVQTRRVVLGGITGHPNEARMQQVAGSVTDSFDGPLLGAKCLIHDRDGKYSQSFDHTLASAGIKPIKLPPRSRNLTAQAEHWVLSLKAEVLDHLILFTERQVRRVLKQYLAHYHAERCHQGIEGRLIAPQLPDGTAGTGEVVRRKRLGGLLSITTAALPESCCAQPCSFADGSAHARPDPSQIVRKRRCAGENPVLPPRTAAKPAGNKGSRAGP